MVTAIDDEAIWELRPRAVVAATGTYELVPAVPGSDRPGVMERPTGRSPDRGVIGVAARRAGVLVGDGEDLATAGAALRAAGATVVGADPDECALARSGARGRWRGPRSSGDDGASRRESVDLVVFGDRTPNLDLVLAAGAGVGWRDERLAPQLMPTAGPPCRPVRGRRWRQSGPAQVQPPTGRDAPDEPRPRSLPDRSGCGAADARTADSRPVTPRTGDPPRSATDGPRRRGLGRARCCASARTSAAGSPVGARGRLRGPGARQAPDGRAHRSVPGQVLPVGGDVCPATAEPAGRRAAATCRCPPAGRRYDPIRLGDLVTDEAPAGAVGDRTERDGDVPRPSDAARHRPTSSSSARASAASPSPASCSPTGMRDIVIVERGYPGSGATGRNVARIRAMQLTEELTHVARACQDKYDRMGDELGFNVLFYRLGYAWVLYDADELERMRDIVAMHHRIGVRSALLSPDDTLRRLPVLRGGDPVAGAVLNDDAIVHHDAVVWAHLEHLARAAGSGTRRRRRPVRPTHVERRRVTRRRGRRDGSRPDRDPSASSTRPAAGPASSTPWPASCPEPPASGARCS